MTCREVARLLSMDAVAEGVLSDRLRVKLHLFFCKHCRRYARELQAIGAAGREIWGDCMGERDVLDRLEDAILKDIGGTRDSEPAGG